MASFCLGRQAKKPRKAVLVPDWSASVASAPSVHSSSPGTHKSFHFSFLRQCCKSKGLYHVKTSSKGIGQYEEEVEHVKKETEMKGWRLTANSAEVSHRETPVGGASMQQLELFPFSREPFRTEPRELLVLPIFPHVGSQNPSRLDDRMIATEGGALVSLNAALLNCFHSAAI